MPATDRRGRARPLRALTTAPPPPPLVPRLAFVAAASAVCAVVAPAIVISLYAAAIPAPDRITAFAIGVAEPVALVAAVLVTASGARWAASGRSRPRVVGLLAGVGAALLVLGCAAWVGDVDGWTAGAMVLQPLAGLVGGVRARRDAARRARAGSAARCPERDRWRDDGTADDDGRRPATRPVTPAVAFEATLLPPTLRDPRGARGDEAVGLATPPDSIPAARAAPPVRRAAADPANG